MSGGRRASEHFLLHPRWGVQLRPCRRMQSRLHGCAGSDDGTCQRKNKTAAPPSTHTDTHLAVWSSQQLGAAVAGVQLYGVLVAVQDARVVRAAAGEVVDVHV